MPEIDSNPQIISNQDKSRRKKILLFLIIGVSLTILGLLVFFTTRTKTESIYPVSIKKSTPSADTAKPKISEDKKPVSPKLIAYPIKVPVVVLKYFPTSNGTTTMYGSIINMRKKTDEITKQLVETLERGSSYHAYKNLKAIPSLDYSVVKSIEFLKRVPLSSKFIDKGDKFKMFSDSSIGISNICEYVDGKGVKEVWIWMYHTEETKLGDLTINKTTPTESNMAMGKDFSKYWNYGSFGDVSNSAKVNDLPVCKNTYTVYEYNYSRQLSEALEDHMHQIEAVLNWVDNRNKTSSDKWEDLLFWGKFVGSGASHKIINPGCGWAHYPPNGESDYDWKNSKYVNSDCEDWTPDHSGKKQSFNCNKWSCDSVRFFKWWMQNIPGKDNGLKYNGNHLRNWWDFIGNFDQAMKKGKRLTN